MLRIGFVVVAILLAVPWLAQAQDCMSHVKTTQQTLDETQGRVAGVPEAKRARVQGFLDDAARVLVQARDNCERAQSPLDRSYAIAKVLVAQGNISAAHLLIKSEE